MDRASCIHLLVAQSLYLVYCHCVTGQWGVLLVGRGVGGSACIGDTRYITVLYVRECIV